MIGRMSALLWKQNAGRNRPLTPDQAGLLCEQGTMAEWEPGEPTRDKARYDLNLDIRKRNVFVTQLGEAREEDENVTQLPVIKEAASKILENSKNTLQRTLVLKKEVEYDHVSQELLAKRREFSDRKHALDVRKEEFSQKQTEYTEKAANFEKFLQDSDVRRRRAILKYQTEAKQNELRDMEINKLVKQLEEKKIRQQKLHEKVKKLKLFEEFLLRTVDIVPENYLEYGVDSPVKAIIRRYETLSLTNESLVNNLTVLADEQENKQHELENLQQQHDTLKLMMTSELSQLQMDYDILLEKNKQLELKFNLDKGQFRNQSVEVASLLMSITNLSEQCHLKHFRSIDEAELLQKLDMIKEFILEKSQVEKLATHLSEERPSLFNLDDQTLKHKRTSKKPFKIKVSEVQHQDNKNSNNRRVSIVEAKI
ncbi:hypothetical protein XENTR_v10021625 [Xenopus tropicalis]|uniref:Uncharacterized protein CCDC197 n=1 Tax=Xenopus tropicalis TaxID=8364 RepID=A0A8J1IPL5_XENTR|nr:uncharacterized protein CCDC197 [Xenopus tropicalis]KAE8586316.1 hypothetical protein XENTR_v10021625 [Xenopus tropicalis]